MPLTAIPDKTVGRLSLYRCILTDMLTMGVENIFSLPVAAMIGGTAAQVRREPALRARVRGHPQVRADLAHARQPGGHPPCGPRRRLLLLHHGAGRRPGHGGQINPENYTPRTLKSDLQFHGRLPFEECVRIGLALTTALEHLHGNGLVHRDVKPSNIIFVNGVPKLADIGLVTGRGRHALLCGHRRLRRTRKARARRKPTLQPGQGALRDGHRQRPAGIPRTADATCANCPTAKDWWNSTR